MLVANLIEKKLAVLDEDFANWVPPVFSPRLFLRYSMAPATEMKKNQIKGSTYFCYKKTNCRKEL